MDRAAATSGLVAGLLAGAAATAATLVAAELAGQPSIAETLAEAIVPATPIQLIVLMTATFGAAAKRMLFGSVLAGQLLAGAAFGLLLWRASPRGALAAVAGAAGAIAMLALPALGAGVGGVATRAGAAASMMSLGLAGGLYRAGYLALSGWLRSLRRQPDSPQTAEDRRAVLREALLSVGACATGAAGVRALSDRRWAAAPLAALGAGLG